MSELPLRRVSDHELRWGHAPTGGLIGLILGLAVAAFALTRGQGGAATASRGDGWTLRAVRPVRPALAR